MTEAVEKKSSKAIWWIIGLLVIGVAAYFLYPRFIKPQMSVGEFREQITKKVNHELQSKDHGLRKLVEKAHATVNVKDAFVSNCKVVTEDGTDVVGNDGKNVKNIDCELTMLWDGKLHKNGKTVLGVTLKNVGGKFQMGKHKIISTNAIVNLADPVFWANLAAIFGMIILL